MAFIDFTESELVNVKDIDNQHLKMVNIINRIHSGITKNRNYNYTSDLRVLIDEIEFHFETEERYMKENHFPGYYSHKLEHDRFFTQMVNNFEKMKEDRSINIGEQLISFKRWFYNHLDLSDKKCGTFLNSKGIL
ncbi:MAG: bacteriohemerythrin [Melioribacter sp.]|nr:bacteriohemerythrin [Melioribacter sp.]